MFGVISSGGHCETCQGTSFGRYFPRNWRAESGISAFWNLADILEFVKQLLLPGILPEFCAEFACFL